MLSDRLLVFAGFVFFHTQAFAASNSFDRAIQRLVDSDPIYQQVLSDAAGEKALAIEDESSWHPEIKLSSAKVFDQSRTSGDSWKLSEKGRMTLEGSLNLYAFGRDRAAWNLAEVRKAKFEIEQRRALIEAQDRAARLLLKYVVAFRESELDRNKVNLRRRLLQIGQLRYDRGLMNEQELGILEADADTAQLDLQARERELRDVVNLMQSRIGDADLPRQMPLEQASDNRILEKKLAQMAELQSSSLDIEHQKLAVASKDLQLLRSSKAFYPTIDLESRLEHTFGMTKQGQNSQWALVVTYPLIDRGTRLSEEQHLTEERNSAKFTLQDIQLRNEVDAKNLKQGISASINELNIRMRLLSRSDAILNSNQSRFAQGRYTANDLGRDEERLSEAQVGLLQTWESIHDQFLKMCKIHGIKASDCFTLRGDQ